MSSDGRMATGPNAILETVLNEYGLGADSFFEDLAESDTDRLLLALLLEERNEQSIADLRLNNREKERDASQTAVYTNRQGVTAESGTNRLDLSFVADTIAVRNLSDELDIAFKDPDGTTDAFITLESGDSPFILSGVYGIATNRVWYTQGANANGTHSFELLAVKRRGR